MGKISARHILVEKSFEIEDIQKKLNAGESFSKLAEKFSRCPSAKSGGDLGEFGPGRMVLPFDEAAFQLAVNEVSGPVQTRFGYHLIQRYK